jgi:hypothetical protein
MPPGRDYGSGAVDVYPLDADGLPGKRVHGRDQGRKLAHCVLPSPDNRFVYIPYVKEASGLFQSLSIWIRSGDRSARAARSAKRRAARRLGSAASG